MIAGLVEAGQELFTYMGNDYVAAAGMVTCMHDFPVNFKIAAWSFIKSENKISATLVMLGFTSKKSQIKKFYDCNFSEADGTPDVLPDGTLGQREFVNCPNRGNCSGEGILCIIPYGMSKREIQVVRLIGNGLLDKEICDQLGIANDTLRNHKDSICRKAGIERKSSIAVLASKLNLV